MVQMSNVPITTLILKTAKKLSQEERTFHQRAELFDVV